MRGKAWLLIAALAVGQAGPVMAQGAPAPAPASPADWKPARRGYSLKRCLELAAQNYPKIHEARAKLKHKRGQLFEARTAPYSDFTMTGGLGPAPTVRGTSIYSPNTDVSLTSNMALAWQIGIDGTIPLWTFGKIDNLWDAAEAQVKVGEYEVQKEKNDVQLDVRRAFYGLQLARDSQLLIREAEERIDKYIDRLAAKVADGEGDDIELLKLRMQRADLEARATEADRGEQVALAGLRFLTGVRDVDIPDQPLRRTRHALGPPTRYLEAARLFRPEINMARAGVSARRAQVRLARSRYYPDVGVSVSARWARAPEVTDQVNPYVYDRANFFHYGAALVFKWKLDFLPQTARIAQAEADLEEVRAKERYALGGVGVEVETAYADAKAAERRLEATTRALGYAKQWLIKVQQGIDVGTFDDEDIVDPAKEYALKKFAQMSAIYDFNLAVAKLAQVTGWEAVARE
jgi:outer membrane protein TolC